MRNQVINRRYRQLQALLLMLVICIVSMLTPVTSMAASAPGEPREEGRFVYDQADLLNDEAEFEAEIASLRQELMIDVVLVTTEDAEGLSSCDYADDFYDYNDFGYDKPRGDGVLFLIDMDNREAYVSTTGKAIAYFTDQRISDLLDTVVEDYLSREDYDGACRYFLSRVSPIMNSEPGTVVPEGPPLSFGQRILLALRRWGIYLLIASAVLALILTTSVVKSGKIKTVPASVYLDKNGGFDLVQKKDAFLGENVSKVYSPPSSSSSSGGTSSTHTSHSGTSHGGGGRSF